MAVLSLANYLSAGTPIIYLRSGDYVSALRFIKREVQASAYRCADGSMVTKTLSEWTVADGLTAVSEVGNLLQAPSPAITPLIEMSKMLADNKPRVFVLYDYHKFIIQPQIWRALVLMVDRLAKTNSNIILLSPEVVVPHEIENFVTVIDYPLPSHSELCAITEKTLKDNSVDCSAIDIAAVASVGLGLPRISYLNSLYLLIGSCPVTTANACKIMKLQKENRILQTDLLKLLHSERDFSSLAGLDVMKNFTKRMILGGLGRGILILGVPGGGKTAFCSCLGKETNRPVIQMDFGRLMGGIVGETESKTASALEMVDAMQPAILFVDEIEKGLAGTSGANGDSGTSRRQGGQFLRWLSDHDSDVYVVATANDISQLPSEFLRAERWDTIFFVDLPDEEQSKAMFDMYRVEYNLVEDTSLQLRDIHDWTGAEIKSLCRIAAGTGVSLKEASSMVVPMCKVANSKLEALRAAASQFAVSANITKNTPSSQGFVGGVRRRDID